MKIASTTLATLIIGAGLLLGVLHLLPDEELLPGAAAWLADEVPPFPDEENAHLHLWGFAAARGEAPLTRGRKVITVLQQPDPAWMDMDPPPRAIGNADGVQPAGLDELCDPLNDDCLAVYRNDISAVLAREDNALLLERYRALLTVPHYRKVERPYLKMPSPPYGKAIAVQKLYLAVAAGHYLRGDAAPGLTMLEADLRFWRMVMAEGNGMIAKMVAVKMVARDMRLLALLLDSREATPELLRFVADIAPLSEAELDMEWAFRDQFRLLETMVEEMIEAPASERSQGNLLLLVAPFKPNAMINDLYRLNADMLKASHQPVEQVAISMRASVERHIDQFGWWDYLYSPLNAIASTTAIPDFSRYVFNLHDLDAFMTLVKAKARIRAAGIGPSEVAAYLEGDAQARVYGGLQAPVQWDPETSELYYQTQPSDGEHRPWLQSVPLSFEQKSVPEEAG